MHYPRFKPNTVVTRRAVTRRYGPGTSRSRKKRKWYDWYSQLYRHELWIIKHDSCTLSMTFNVNFTVGLWVSMIVLFPSESYIFSEWLFNFKMIELFFALMLCIIREILNIGNDNVFIETGNKNDRNRDKTMLIFAIENSRYRGGRFIFTMQRRENTNLFPSYE